MQDKKMRLSGTFVPNKYEAIHRWYPYIEGFSWQLVTRELDLLKSYEIKNIYDPFGGAGTTLLVASQKNIRPYYSEVNPFMAYVCDTKINSTRKALDDNKIILQLKELYDYLSEYRFIKSEIDVYYDGFEKFFRSATLINLLDLLEIIKKFCTNLAAYNLARLGVASIVVQVSKMIRRGDLRYAKDNEKNNVFSDVKTMYLNKLREIIEDIEYKGLTLRKDVTLVHEDCRKIDIYDKFDCVITSPPYLNGTNYIRNTKLELKLLGFINNENDLPPLYSKGIMAGINNVSKRITNIELLDEVRPYINEIEPIAYDRRIPIMIAGYFSDMNKVLYKLRESMKNEGIFIMDIGDSQFSNVHIPTHDILMKIAAKHGFRVYDEEVLRTRRSKNGMILSQRVLRFKLKK